MNISLKITEPQHLKSAQNISMDDGKKIKAAETAKNFEALLTSVMVKSMFSSSGGIFGESSMGGDYFESMFQDKISSNMGKKMDLGIASMIYKKITGEDINSIKPNLQIPDNLNDLSPLKPGMHSIERLNRFDSIINEASKKYQVDPLLIKSVILTESAANEKALSKTNAKGLMQLMDGTSTDLGVNNPWDPVENINGGTKYLSMMLEKFNGNINLALAAYNAGPGNVEKYNGIPPFEETKNYVNRVGAYYNHFKSEI